MRCPYCQENDDRVVDSRESREGVTIRRRRECNACKRRFTSYEQIEEIPYMVVKRDGSREEFSRVKLLGGLLRACQKRPISTQQLEDIAEEVERRLHHGDNREIQSEEIGTLLMRRLHDLDQVAYVRFASVYRRFEDVDQFRAVLTGLTPDPEASEGQDT